MIPWYVSATTENNVSQAHEKTVSTLNAPEHAANGTAELRVEHQLSIPDCSAIVKSEYELHGFNAATSSSEEQEGEKVKFFSDLHHLSFCEQTSRCMLALAGTRFVQQ